MQDTPPNYFARDTSVFQLTSEEYPMNSIVYIVGIIVIIAVILSFFGLR